MIAIEKGDSNGIPVLQSNLDSWDGRTSCESTKS